ncbi:MAG: hypothetical protein ACI814_000546 [Mariniblastus sp.]|jgi:hypothetical protein
MSRIRIGKYQLLAIAVVLIGGVVFAQDYQRRSSRSQDRSAYDDRAGVPLWKKSKEFQHDVFTFARIHYDSVISDRYDDSTYRGGRGGVQSKWRTDFPDADLNLSYRLKELTSLEVDPNGVVIRLTDESLFDYPFIYIIEPGHLRFSEAEVVALRRYLTKGGFLMVDDFWGEYEWENFRKQMKRVFPNRDASEVPLEHEIFHIVYDLKTKPMIPSIQSYMWGRRSERRDAQEAHYRGIFDDEDRMMVFICHNTDLGDGWEREGEDQGYFEKYSEPYAYPLGINIVTYAMTH